MLRLAYPPHSGRLGGWVLIEILPQQTATGGQRWSLVILAVAAFVAMAAVIFDFRLPTTTLTTTLQLNDGDGAAAAPQLRDPGRSQPRIEPPAPISTDPRPRSATTASTATDTTATTLISDRNGERVQSADSSDSVATASSSTLAVFQADVAGSDDSTAVAELAGNPAASIRAYLGLHAGAQLPVSFSYEVQEGDTASSIAASFGLEEDTVLFNNFDIYDADHLAVGQTLQLPSLDGVIYTVQPQDTLTRLEQNFQADIQATVAFPANSIRSPDDIKVGQKLLLVQGSASISGAVSTGGTVIVSQGAPTVFEWPLAFDRISDLFGVERSNSFGYHTGVDFEAKVGTIVGPTAAGQVTVATWDPSYGNWVEIDHGGGYRSRYGHLDQIWVREGQLVQSNTDDYIGTVGNTGYSTGAHLHFEIIIDGKAVDPLSWLKK